MMVFLFPPRGRLAAKVRQHFDVRCGKPVPFIPPEPYFLYRVSGEMALGQVKPTKVMNGLVPKLLEYRKGNEIYHEEICGQVRLEVDFRGCLPVKANPWGPYATIFFIALKGKEGIVEKSLWLLCEMENMIYAIADFLATDKIQRERVARMN
jgi:hypothetical protein